jgi:hypothetical protein
VEKLMSMINRIAAQVRMKEVTERIILPSRRTWFPVNVKKARMYPLLLTWFSNVYMKPVQNERFCNI